MLLGMDPSTIVAMELYTSITVAFGTDATMRPMAAFVLDQWVLGAVRLLGLKLQSCSVELQCRVLCFACRTGAFMVFTELRLHLTDNTQDFYVLNDCILRDTTAAYMMAMVLQALG